MANITVFYVMSEKVYKVTGMMEKILDIKRFIDDGEGLHLGNEEKFPEWLRKVNRLLRPFGLYIDESNYKTTSNFINLLDILYSFDENGILQSDLYRTETDSQAYLNFSSAHPNHTFSGNGYSQSLRLRRIINSKDRLHIRLEELQKHSKKQDILKNGQKHNK